MSGSDQIDLMGSARLEADWCQVGDTRKHATGLTAPRSAQPCYGDDPFDRAYR